jgi:hypothetical protein
LNYINKDNNLLNYLLNLLDSSKLLEANICSRIIIFNYIIQSIEIGNHIGNDIDIDDLIYIISIGIKSNKRSKKNEKQLKRLQSCKLPEL